MNSRICRDHRSGKRYWSRIHLLDATLRVRWKAASSAAMTCGDDALSKQKTITQYNHQGGRVQKALSLEQVECKLNCSLKYTDGARRRWQVLLILSSCSKRRVFFYLNFSMSELSKESESLLVGNDNIMIPHFLQRLEEFS